MLFYQIRCRVVPGTQGVFLCTNSTKLIIMDITNTHINRDVGILLSQKPGSSWVAALERARSIPSVVVESLVTGQCTDPDLAQHKLFDGKSPECRTAMYDIKDAHRLVASVQIGNAKCLEINVFFVNVKKQLALALRLAVESASPHRALVVDCQPSLQ